MTETLHRLLDGVYLACIWISGIAILLMSLIIPWGIYARYVMGSGSSWPEPVAVLADGDLHLLRRRGHVPGLGPYRRRHADRSAARAPAVDLHQGGRCADDAGICVFVMVWGSKLSMEMMRQGLAELPWLPVGYTYLPLPIGCFLILLFVLENTLAGPQNQRAVVTFDHEQAEPAAGAL